MGYDTSILRKTKAKGSLEVSSESAFPLQGSSCEVRDEDVENMAASSPLYDSSLKSGGQPAGLTQAHFLEYFNKFKETKFWLGNWGSTPNSKNDWRIKENNGLCDIDQRVRLFAEMDKLEISYGNTFNEGGDIFPKAVGGFMNTVTDALDSLAVFSPTPVPAVNRISPFDDPKTWEKTSPIKFGGDLNFNFKFGQAGIFSGYEEVVKPIYAIGALFAPGSPGSKGWTPPLPTKAQWAAMFLSSAFKNLISPDGFAGGGLVDTAVNLVNKYFASIHAGATAVATHGGYGAGENRLAYFQFGHFVLGPCTVKDVKMQFDTINIDDAGFPTSGKLSLTGIETYITAVREAIYGTLWAGGESGIVEGDESSGYKPDSGNLDASAVSKQGTGNSVDANGVGSANGRTVDD